MAAPRISVVVPAFNEEETITTTVARLTEAVGAIDAGFEILVVDNASTDRTGEVLRDALRDPRVRLLRNERNRGKGHSVRRGMLEARGAIRLHCDADCAGSLVSLPALLADLERADVVVGSRALAGAQVGARQPLRRRIASHGFILLCRLALGPLPRDIFCGFKLWRAEAAEAVFARVDVTGWAFDAEALALARALGLDVAERGIVWDHRAGSRLRMGRILVPVLRELRHARSAVRAARRDVVATRETAATAGPVA